MKQPQCLAESIRTSPRCYYGRDVFVRVTGVPKSTSGWNCWNFRAVEWNAPWPHGTGIKMFFDGWFSERGPFHLHKAEVKTMIIHDQG